MSVVPCATVACCTGTLAEYLHEKCYYYLACHVNQIKKGKQQNWSQNGILIRQKYPQK